MTRHRFNLPVVLKFHKFEMIRPVMLRRIGMVKRYNSDLVNKNKGELISRIQSLPPADVVSGVPEELKARMVRIYQPSKSATQSGLEQTRSWKIDFDILEYSSTWENDLIGYTSS